MSFNFQIWKILRMIDKVFLTKNENEKSITKIGNSFKKTNYKTGEVYNEVYHKNFTIREYQDKTTILGSINKFGVGNNYENITYNKSIELINLLGSEIGIDLSNFNIYQLEIGSCFVMEQEPCFYIDNLIYLSRYKSGVYYSKQKPTGKVFETQMNKYIAYDKVKEIRAKGEQLKNDFQGLNLLRIEDKYFKQIKKSLKFVPKVSDLQNNELKIKLITNYKNKFENIIKVLDLEIPTNYKTFGDYKKALLLINTKDTEALLNDFNRKQSNNEIVPSEASKIRKFLKERQKLASGFNLTDKMNLELKDKLNDRINFELQDTI